MVPGQNILNMALSVIARQTIVYYKYNSRALNDVGQDVTVYDAPVNIVGSVQAVQRDLIDKYGLDLQKNYVVLYTSTDMIDVGRDVSGDQIEFSGIRFQCESDTYWFPLDGWVALICVQIREV